jgi:MoaA/NifB/PqqE/SkfB family radical SAM enzyme
MNKLSLIDQLKFITSRVSNLFIPQLLTVSFETTLSCNCNCKHCDLGGIKKEENQIGPKDYAKIVRELKPLVVQISGGEPLLRKDIFEIVKSTKQFGNLPYTILVTNGVLLTEEIYLKLKEAGLNQLSVSLDFPDKRHDEFRRHPGLFSHLENVIPKLAKHGFDDIILNSAITRENFREIIPLAKKAKEWGVKISYSAYTPLRTGNKQLCIQDEKEKKELREIFKELILLQEKTDLIVNSKNGLLRFLKFLETGYIPNCQAGLSFIVVMPDGSFVPCSLRRIKFKNLEDLRKNFSAKNTCGGCYVAIRCYSEESIFDQIKELPHYWKIIKSKLTF